MPKEKILIIEDEKDINELIQYNLEKEGYRVTAAYDGQGGLDAIKKEVPQLVILDLMLPEIDGLEVCRLIKQGDRTRHVPIIMLTAKSEESDLVVGLQLGADDYVTKPFSPKVLVARVKAILRRVVQKDKPYEMKKIDKLTIDMPRHKITYAGKELDLTMIEFSILEFSNLVIELNIMNF